VVKELHNHGIRTSLFVETDLEQIERAAATGTDRIELYTEPYASKYAGDQTKAIAPYIRAAKKAVELGLELNAGHDLSLENLHYFNQHIPGLKEVSIGHALISDALYYGLEKTIQLYLEQLA
jgi:pyridoxine 5-phosphate synthase